MSVSKEKATQNVLRLTEHINTEDLAHALKSAINELYEMENNLPKIRLEGESALRRLLPVALHSSGQSSVVARFLLNLYNGERFPFDMTDLRQLDYDIYEDCLAVLKMDYYPAQEVHQYFENGSTILESLAERWSFRDHKHSTWR